MPIPNDFWKQDATMLSRRIAEGEFRPSDLLKATLDRCHRLNPALNAFVHVEEAQAADAARAADARQRAGRRNGVLDGIPVAVKDNIFVAGMPARWGSRLFRDFTPEQDDIAVERLRAAGAVIIGKTNTPEFALSGRTDSPLHGPCLNPWDLSLTPGGSSGGSVAAVAAGLVPLALGTDAGGSTRLPASYTGLLGLRPSNGRVPRRHGFPPMALDFQAIGLIARSTADLEALYGVVAGPDPRDPASCRFMANTAAASGRSLRIGWFAAVGDEAVDPEVAARTRAVADLLARHGFQVESCAPPYDLAALREIWATLTAAGAARVAAAFPERWRGEASEGIATLVERGLRLSAIDLVRTLDRLAELRASVGEHWGRHDLLLTPTAASPAWAYQQPFPRQIGGKPGHAAAQSVFAGWVNAVGYPALSVPAGSHPDGRLIGVQLVGRHGADQLVIHTAHRLEGLEPWAGAWPALAS